MDETRQQYIGLKGAIWKFLASYNSRKELRDIYRKHGVSFSVANKFKYSRCVEKSRYSESRGRIGTDCSYRLLLLHANEVKNSGQMRASRKFYGSVYYRGEHCHALEKSQ